MTGNLIVGLILQKLKSLFIRDNTAFNVVAERNHTDPTDFTNSDFSV